MWSLWHLKVQQTKERTIGIEETQPREGTKAAKAKAREAAEEEEKRSSKEQQQPLESNDRSADGTVAYQDGRS